MKFIEDYCIAYNNNSTLYGYSIRKLFNSVSIYIMPMVNPDGVDLVTGVINSSYPSYQKTLNISNEFPNIPFPNRMESKYKWCGFKKIPTGLQSLVTIKITLLCVFDCSYLLALQFL